MKLKSRIIVSALIISKDKKILFGKVREGGAYPDCWHIPGGGVDEGEDKITAVIREIKEEVGLDIKNSSIILLPHTDTGEAIKTDKNTGEKFLAKMQFNVFEVNLDTHAQDIIITLNDDLKEYKWVSMKDLKSIKHTPPSEKYFKKVGWI